MRTIAMLGGLALALALALPVAAEPPAMTDAVQAQMGPGMGGPGTGGPGMQAPRGPGRWQGRGGHGKMRRGRSYAMTALRYQQQLGLSAQQVESLQKLGMDSARASIRRRADGQLARLDLVGLLRTTPVDMSKVETKVREIEKFRADGTIARIRTNEAAKALLTADQQEKLKTLRAARWQRRGGGSGGAEDESNDSPAPRDRS